MAPVEFKHVRGLKFFSGISSDAVARLLKTATIRHFATNSVLFREGAQPLCIYLALDGLVALKTSDDKANDFVIEFIEPGRPFDVAAVMMNEPYLGTGEVLKSGQILEIPAEVFRRLVESNLRLASALIRSMAQHRQPMIRHVKALKTQSGPERLADFLASLADKEKGRATITLPCQRQVLAGWLGMVPTTASRAFRRLKDQGVEGRGEQLTIKSVERLRAFAKL